MGWQMSRRISHQAGCVESRKQRRVWCRSDTYADVKTLIDHLEASHPLCYMSSRNAYRINNDLLRTGWTQPWCTCTHRIKSQISARGGQGSEKIPTKWKAQFQKSGCARYKQQYVRKRNSIRTDFCNYTVFISRNRVCVPPIHRCALQSPSMR